jgi:hypothetical protein
MKKLHRAAISNGRNMSITCDGQEANYRLVKNGDSFVLRENDAGIYIEVTIHSGNVWCKEKLYSMGRDDPDFYLYERTWGGDGHNPQAKYKREKLYPVGKQVRLHGSGPKADNRSEVSTGACQS